MINISNIHFVLSLRKSDLIQTVQTTEECLFLTHGGSSEVVLHVVAVYTNTHPAFMDGENALV